MALPELLSEPRATFDRTGVAEANVFDAAKRAEVLFLDDVGAQYIKEAEGWSAEVIHRLIDARYDGQLLTVITTNHKPGVQLAEKIGSRAIDRLVEVGKAIEVSGPSLRVRLVAD